MPKNKIEETKDEQTTQDQKNQSDSSSLNITYEEELITDQNKQSTENSNPDNLLFTSETNPPITTNQEDNSFLLNVNPMNINDDMSDSGYMNRNFEMNLEEIFENMSYLLTTQKNKIKIEKDHLNKVMQEFLEFKARENQKLEKENEKWKTNMKRANEMNAQSKDLVDLDIGGTFKITTSRQILMKYPSSALGSMFNGKHELPLHNNRVFIDRDGQAFMNMISFLRNGKMPPFIDDKDKQNFKDELNFWQIPFNEGKETNQSCFVFDFEWCAKTLSIESNGSLIKKHNIQHGIVFCKPPLDENNSFIKFKVTISSFCRGKTHLFLGIVDKSKYKYENLRSTYWKDSPSSFYWDTWNTKLIKTDDKGVQVGSMNGYGCQCEETETYLSIKYDSINKTISFFKNNMNLGVAFKNVPSGMTPSLDIWFESGTVEIIKNAKNEIEEYFL